MSSKGFWSKSLKRVQRKKSGGHVSRRRDKTSLILHSDGHNFNSPKKSSLGIRGPFDAQNVVVVSSVGPMQDERRKFADKMIGRSPDLYVGTMGDSNEPAFQRTQ